MKKVSSRFIIMAVVFLILMGALIYQLSTLTIASGEELSTEASDRMTREVEIKGVRGRILDRNGVVLAYSETCYDVQFFRDPEKRTTNDSALYTEALIKAIEIIEESGGTTIDTSYITMNEEGELVYDWGVTSESAIKARYKNFIDAMGINISEENIDDMSKWPTAEYMYNYLRRSWQIPEELPFEDAVKVISIRQEVLLNNYRAYQPVTIAYDVGMDVVAQIDMLSEELPGLQTTQSTTRVYPRGTTASHILGYLSRSANTVSVSTLDAMGYERSDYEEYIELDENSSEVVNMIKMGYSYDDMIGVSGVERTMEAYLTGAIDARQGARVIEVNKYGSMIRELSESSASDGNDVMLTIDVDLQQVTEKALEDLITDISTMQKDRIANPEKYNLKANKYIEATQGRENGVDSIKTASTGAIVVMDVNKGQVLASASYPGFDPNVFIEGLSTEEAYELFQSEWAAATTPMRNKAISATLAPGSIFKMCTGLAGLMEGVITLDERIDDGGSEEEYQKYRGVYVIYEENEDGSVTAITDGAPKCHTNYPRRYHMDQDLVAALKNSCNYYFYEVANRLGIERLNAWAENMGLASSTGIELTGEAVGYVGGQAVLYDHTRLVTEQKTSLPTLVYRQICELLRGYLRERGMEIDEDAVAVCAERLLELQDGSVANKGGEVRAIMREELGIPEGISQQNNWAGQITSRLTELQWKATQTIRTGIGQGTTMVTPMAIARYVSAIANGGTVYDAHIVERILDAEGGTVEEVEPSVFYEVDAPEEYFEAIREGMSQVVSPEDGGTAAEAFSESFKNKGYDKIISGKTGSAQIGGTIDIENTSWFVAFTPRGDDPENPGEVPEIAIVVCIPNGFSGSSSAAAIEDIVTYYTEKKMAAAPENLVDVNALVP